MNDIQKSLLSLLGGFNVIFSILTPIMLSILIIKVYDFKDVIFISSTFSESLLVIVGILSSVYRSINVGIIPLLKRDK